MKYMILLSDNADIREIFSSRSDLTEEVRRVPTGQTFTNPTTAARSLRQPGFEVKSVWR